MKTFIIKLLSLCVVITAIYLLVTTEYKDDLRKPRKEYDKTGYELVADGNLTNTNKLVTENSETGLKLYIDETTSHIGLENTNTGQMWTSNVQEKDGFKGIVTSIKNLQKSTLKIWYYSKLEDPTSMVNYEFSIEEQNYYLRYIPNGVEVLYIIYDTSYSVYDLPQRISIERMESLVLDKLDELIASADDDDEKLDLKIDKRRIISNYMYNEKHGIYVLKNPDSLSPNNINILHRILFETADYTIQELEYDNEVQGVSDDNGKPYFEVGVRYTLTDNGFKATIINESLYENKHFRISHIDLLPYFGAGSVDDDGYIVVPDGSGAIMNFNNGKTYASKYEKTLYGKDYGQAVYFAPEESYNASMPIFGMKKNDDAFLAIITDGDAMASIVADVSEKYDSYNKVFARFYCRQKDKLPLLGIGNKINMWSIDLNSTDYSIEFRFPENKSYSGMAESYREYLKVLGMKEKENNGLRLNLTFLGGYSDTEHFLGIPYSEVQPLTTTNQAEKIIQQLLDDDIKNIDVSYRGWMNGGLSHSFPNSIDIEKAIGGEKGIKSLINYCESQDINLFFETDFLHVNSTDHFNKGKEATRLMSGDVATHYPFNDVTLLPDITKNPYWVLNPYSIKSNLNKMNKDYQKYGLDNISLTDFGNILSGHYDEKDFYYKNETLDIILDNFKIIDDSYNLTMAHSPNIYSTPYLNHIVDLPLESSYYSILDGDIPFYQLAITDSINYAGNAINLDEKHDIDWHLLKAIETGSNINFTWSYSNTFNLMNTDYNQYYSTQYKDWYDDTVKLYKELDSLGIYNEKLIEHEIINETVRRVKYSGGTEIYINYGNSDCELENLTILANSYTLI